MSGREKKETGGSRKTAAEKAEEMTSAFSKDQQQLLQPHPFPHKSRRRMMIQQLSLQPLLLQPQPLLFPQQQHKMIEKAEKSSIYRVLEVFDSCKIRRNGCYSYFIRISSFLHHTKNV